MILLTMSIAASVCATDLNVLNDSISSVSIVDSTMYFQETSMISDPAANFIIPAVLISYGALAQTVNPLERLDDHISMEVERNNIKRNTIDDYLQITPMAVAVGMNIMGVKAAHNFRDRTFVELSSFMIMGGTVQVIKRATNIPRPDGSNNQSFPSGHTAFAFTGAHILYKEYKDLSPWIGIAGYATATTVGAMRILNRKHRLSDVVAGAGVGILSTEISYMLLPVFHRIIGVKEDEPALVIAPMIGNGQYGVGVAYVF
ncbi:MAG: phosphatase PAP2 family protein [Tannerella sp.]|nr:phosphatase PAP2 family protein [Tannerella sp.]